MPTLFDSIQLGDLHLPNRIFMAPLTRLRGTADHIPTPIMAEYYAQRASAGLIISEGIPIDPLGVGYANVPGLWSREQVDAWRPIVKAVHAQGGHIFAQIWHVGSFSPSLIGMQDSMEPVTRLSPSGLAAAERPLGRAMDLDDVERVIAQFMRDSSGNLPDRHHLFGSEKLLVVFALPQPLSLQPGRKNIGDDL